MESVFPSPRRIWHHGELLLITNRLRIWRSPRRVSQIVQIDRDVYPAAANREQAEVIEGLAGLALLGLEIECEGFVVQLDRDAADAGVGGGLVGERGSVALGGGEATRAVLARASVTLR